MAWYITFLYLILFAVQLSRCVFACGFVRARVCCRCGRGNCDDGWSNMCGLGEAGGRDSPAHLGGYSCRSCLRHLAAMALASPVECLPGKRIQKPGHASQDLAVGMNGDRLTIISSPLLTNECVARETLSNGSRGKHCLLTQASKAKCLA
ncbi:hypothetical protein GQ53DRAFT_180114 [Thozetella sp. PMI_491]|nr:hypothetical protein GQ53DRAFT_180114 [Thozetella sp. PMI_491]